MRTRNYGKGKEPSRRPNGQPKHRVTVSDEERGVSPFSHSSHDSDSKQNSVRSRAASGGSAKGNKSGKQPLKDGVKSTKTNQVKPDVVTLNIRPHPASGGDRRGVELIEQKGALQQTTSLHTQPGRPPAKVTTQSTDAKIESTSSVLNTLEKYTPPVVGKLLVAANLAASFLVSNSEMMLRSVVITGGGISQWTNRLATILENGPRADMDPMNFGLCCMGYALTLAPSLIYPFAGSDMPNYTGPVLALLSIAAPAIAEFLMKQYALSKASIPAEATAPGNLSWQDFFLRRTQMVKLFGGISDIAFNNVLASRWMSSDRIDYRFWATFPNALFTAGINIHEVQGLQQKIDHRTGVQRNTCAALFCHPAIILFSTALFTGGFYVAAMTYSYFVGSEFVLSMEDTLTSSMQLTVGGLSFLLSQYLSWKEAATKVRMQKAMPENTSAEPLGLQEATDRGEPRSALAIASLTHASGVLEPKTPAP